MCLIYMTLFQFKHYMYNYNVEFDNNLKLKKKSFRQLSIYIYRGYILDGFVYDFYP